MTQQSPCSAEIGFTAPKQNRARIVPKISVERYCLEACPKLTRCHSSHGRLPECVHGENGNRARLWKTGLGEFVAMKENLDIPPDAVRAWRGYHSNSLRVSDFSS